MRKFRNRRQRLPHFCLTSEWGISPCLIQITCYKTNVFISNVGLTSVLLQIECASWTKCFWIKFTACLALEYCVHCVLHECFYLSSEYSVFWLHCILDTILVYVLDSALSCQHVFWTKYVCAGYIECPVQFVHGSVCSGFSLFMVPCVLDSVCPGFSVS